MHNRYCLTLDLKDDPQLISEYEIHHKQVWPEVLSAIKDAGIIEMEIYRHHTRLFMVIETTAGFSFERKQKLDAGNVKVQQWEELMWKYQQALPLSGENDKWMLMDRIFKLSGA